MKNIPWIITALALVLALALYLAKNKSDQKLKDLAVDRGLTVAQLESEIEEWRSLTDQLHADKIKAVREYEDKLKEYREIASKQGTEKVYIERIDTIRQYVWWQPGSDTVRLEDKPEVYVGDIINHKDKWSDIRVYSNGFMVNMDYNIRDSIVFDLIEDKDGWFIKGKSLNPATTVYGLEKLVKKEYPYASFNVYGATGVRLDNSFRFFGAVGFEPTWKFKQFDLSAYGEAGAFSSSEMYGEVGVKVGYRLK